MIDNQLQANADGEHNALTVAVQGAHLTKYDSACRALAEASAVDEVKDVLDQALKLRLYAKIAENKQLERDAVAIRAWAERRLGEMMAAHAKTFGKAKPPSGKGQHKTDRRVVSQPDGPATLPEAGIDKNLAHRARMSAKLTPKEFEKRVAEMREGKRGSLEIRRAKAVKRPVVPGDDADNSDEVFDEVQIPARVLRSLFLDRIEMVGLAAHYDGPLEPGWAAEFAALARTLSRNGSPWPIGSSKRLVTPKNQRSQGPTSMTAAEIAVTLGGARRNGRGWLCSCPVHPDRTPSMSIDDGDRVPIVVKCFAGCDSREVLAELRRLGLLDDRDDHRGDHRPYRAIQRVSTPCEASGDTIDRVLSRSLPVQGTLAEAYLASRWLDLPVSGDALRYLPPSARYIWPTMVSVITDFVTGQTINLQFTYLALDGSAKAPLPKHEQRRFLASHHIKGGVIRLSDDADVCLRLGLSEGTESALAIQTSFARADRSEIVWAAVNAGNMAELPVVAGIETLVVYADKDTGGAGQRAAQELAARWNRAGRETYIALPDSGDWNERGAA